MVNFSSDQIRCSLVQDHTKNNSTNYILSRVDGTRVDEIGQEDWPHRYRKSRKFFNWKFIDHTPDMRIKTQIRAFQEAFNSVQQITKLKIDYEKDSTLNTDFTIEWKEDIKTFDNKLSVLAHAYLYHPSGHKNCIIEFNDSPESRWFFTPLGWPVEAYLVDSKNIPKARDIQMEIL